MGDHRRVLHTPVCDLLGIDVPIVGTPAVDGLWLGLFRPDGYTRDHTFIARGHELVFDPAVGIQFPGGLHAPQVTPDEIQSARMAISVVEAAC